MWTSESLAPLPCKMLLSWVHDCKKKLGREVQQTESYKLIGLTKGSLMARMVPSGR